VTGDPEASAMSTEPAQAAVRQDLVRVADATLHALRFRDERSRSPVPWEGPVLDLVDSTYPKRSHDEDQRNILRAIEFPRIAGGKPFNTETPWFGELLKDLGQAKGETVKVEH